MRKIRIRVTQKDINSIMTTDTCGTCPVARAIRRHKGLEQAIIGYTRIGIGPKTITHAPKSVGLWIDKYGFTDVDRSTAKPFSFTIEVPDGF